MENKTGKYFKYAIGEIILVVIGILIALSINNWNEERKGKILANHNANGLVRDLKQDTVVLNSYIQFHKRTSAGLEALISLKNKDLNKSIFNDSLYVLYKRNCLNVAEFKDNGNTLTQLKSTGDLVLFNERTKDGILSHEISSNALKVQGDYYRIAFINSTNISKKMLDHTVFGDTTYFKKGKYTGKTFPKGNYSDNLTRELFNELFFLKMTSEYYSNIYMKIHLENTGNLIRFLTNEYEIVEKDYEFD
ncbi:DUF6090 family protein [Algibacter sp.]|uniref:DUF6090 family protein n=1 Tax=Algibacter sp. TaxID=1872428 RepID=UPI003C783E0E